MSPWMMAPRPTCHRTPVAWCQEDMDPLCRQHQHEALAPTSQHWGLGYRRPGQPPAQPMHNTATCDALLGAMLMCTASVGQLSLK